jgi:hypothetical protein
MSSSMQTWIPVAQLCLALFGASAASAQNAPAGADTVHLRFGWHAGLNAQVETTRLQVRVSEGTDSTSGSAQYMMHVAPHPSGLVVSYDNFVFPVTADTGQAAQAGTLAEQAAAMVPKVVVDSAGAFVGIQDVEAVRARLDTLMTQMLEAEEAAAARETIAAMVTEEALAGIAAQEWNAIVGRWAGADLATGERYGFEEQAALPLIPGAVVTMLSEFSVEGRTSCVDGGAAEDCVEIRLVSRADPDVVTALLAQFTEQLRATPGLGLAFESFEMQNEMVLVTEPATLRPHRVRLSKQMKGIFSAEGERGEVSQSEVRTYRYTYTR